MVKTLQRAGRSGAALHITTNQKHMEPTSCASFVPWSDLFSAALDVISFFFAGVFFSVRTSPYQLKEAILRLLRVDRFHGHAVDEFDR